MKLLKSIILWMLFAVWAFSAPIFPQLNNSRVVDDAELFTTHQRAELETKLSNYEKNTSNQIVVVTLKSLHGYDISDYGYQLGRYWGIGQKDKNNGILLIIAPNERKIRIEVGYGLEGALPDATAKTIIENDILPLFKNGNYFAGTINGLKSIMEATKGEYKPQIKENKDISLIVSLIFPAIFILLIFTRLIENNHKNTYKKRLFPALLQSIVAGLITWIMFSVLLISIFISIIVFFITLFGRSYSADNISGYGGGFSDHFGNSGDFGGFSGGGGSFGGGGASGDW